MTDIIETKRLTLRPPRMADAADVVREVNDIEVSRWLTQVPHPYSLTDAIEFIQRQTSGRTFLICSNDVGIGCIGTQGEFGYWLGRAHWGQGFATEAAIAVLDWHFRVDRGALVSGHAIGNDRSRNVLVKLGFRDAGRVQRTHQITGKVREQQLMELNASDWEARP